MKQYQKLFIGLSLLTFISCGSSGGGGGDSSTNDTPKSPINGEVLKKGETSTTPIVAGNGEFQTSNGNISIDDVNKVAMTAENGGQVTNGKDGNVSGVFAVGMKASGTGSKVANDGKIVGGSSVNTARSVALNSNEEINRIGMKASNGGEAVNNGNISGTISEGMVADGKGSSAINNGKVSSTGVKYTDVYTEDGIEYHPGIAAIGMKASKGASVTNNGMISGTIGEGLMADGSGSSAINNGKVSSTGVKYTAIYTEEEIKYNETGISAIGMKAFKGASITNNGTISGTIGEGMVADESGSSAINNGNISSTGAQYGKTYIKDGVKYNETGISATGMKASNGGSVINEKDGIVSGTIGEGMVAYGSGSTAINNGDISSTGVKEIETYTDKDGIIHTDSGINGKGMRAKEGGSITNNGNISGTISDGMRAEGTGSSATNNGKVSSIGVERTETYTDEKGIEYNETGIFAIGMKASKGASIINEKDGIIFGTIGEGMMAEGLGSSAINNGSISSIGIERTNTYTDEDGTIHIGSNTYGTGMNAREGGSITNGVTGTISGTISEGMRAEESGSTAVNNGSISSTGAEYDETYIEDGIEYNETGTYGTGMKASKGASVTNNGNILGNISEGMRAEGTGSSATNNSKISLTGTEGTNIFINNDGIKHIQEEIFGTGMKAYEGGSVINSKDGIISGNISSGMRAQGKDSSAVNYGVINTDGALYLETYDWEPGKEHKYKTLQGRGMYAKDGGSVVNNGAILGNISEGMKAKGTGSSATNNGDISSNGVESTESFVNTKGILENTIKTSGIGMYALESGSITNGATGTISGTISEGMSANGEGSTAVNNGKISSTGVESTNTYTDKDGTIHIDSGTNGTGMNAREGGSITNNGSISGTISEGMRAGGEGSTAVNNGSISSTGTERTDTYTDEDGTIHIDSGTNGGTGMVAYDGGSITNGATGTISGIIREGMRAEESGSTAVNNGEINSIGVKWTEIYIDGKGITQTNSGTNGGTGMLAYDGASILNKKDGTISGTLSEGMKAEGSGSSAINNGEISSTGVEWTNTYTDETEITHIDSGIYGRGMRAKEGGSITNNGKIFGTLSEGMKAEGAGSSAVNNGNISSIGVEWTNSYIDEKGVTQTNSGINGGTGMQAYDGASILNKKDGTISGTISEGMRTEGTGSTAINNGNISSIGVEWTKTYTDEYGTEQPYEGIDGGTGMGTSEGSITNNGKISGILSEGMIAEGSGGTAVNNGEISFNGSTNLSYSLGPNGTIIPGKYMNADGMSSSGGAAITNGKTGVISGALVTGMHGNGTNMGTITIEQIQGELSDLLSINGMKTFDGTIKNSGTININAKNGVGMHVSNGAAAINAEGAFINLNSSNGIGMCATGAESTIENSGTININAENEVGMHVSNGATATNGETGIINLNASNGIGMYGIGMYATGEGSTIENRGEIYLSGSKATPSRDYQTAEEIATGGEIINGKDTNGNIGMKIENGARMINKGQIKFGQ